MNTGKDHQSRFNETVELSMKHNVTKHCVNDQTNVQPFPRGK